MSTLTFKKQIEHEETITINTGDCFKNAAGDEYVKIVSETRHILVSKIGISKHNTYFNLRGDAVVTRIPETEFQEAYNKTLKYISPEVKEIILSVDGEETTLSNFIQANVIDEPQITDEELKAVKQLVINQTIPVGMVQVTRIS